jgi:hypothetical protein
MATKKATRPLEGEGTNQHAQERVVNEAVAASHLRCLSVYLDDLGLDDSRDAVATDTPAAERPPAADLAGLDVATWAVCSMPHLSPPRSRDGQRDLVAQAMVAIRGVAELILAPLGEDYDGQQALQAIRTITIVEGWRLELSIDDTADAEEVAG